MRGSTGRLADGYANTRSRRLTIGACIGSLSLTMTPSRIGKYTVVGPLGGPGEALFLGESGGRRVAIRMPAAADPVEAERLGQEARLVAGLSHPHVVPHEVGLQDDHLFLLSEFSAGDTLEKWLSKTHSLADQLKVVDGIASALSYAHEQGVLHRALKPANIQVGSDGEGRLMSFGLGSSSTALGDAAPTYGAPEVLEGMPDTSQSDIYSAGVVFYEILSGQGTAADEGPVVKPLRELRPDVSKDVADAIMACRERSPDWRPKDLSYLLEVVRRARGEAGPTTKASSAPRPAAATPQPSRRNERSRPGPTFGARKPARSPVPILAAIVLVVVGGAAAWFLSQSPAPGGTSVPTPLPAVTTPTTTPFAPQPPINPGPTVAPATTLAKAGVASTPTPALEPVRTTPPPTTASTPEPVRTTPPPTTTLAPQPTPTPTPPPKIDPVAVAPVDAPLAPAALTAVSPPTVRRGARTLIDVRGTGLRAGMQASLVKGRGPAEGLVVVNQRFVNATLIQVFLEVESGASPGTYSLALADGQGSTNAARFEVAK
jgi:serine/threonine protein kinase